MTASFTPPPGVPAEERFHGSLRYRSVLWNIAATYNKADFYDLFGPTKASRKGYLLSIVYKDDFNKVVDRFFGQPYRTIEADGRFF